jgi:two-component system chemotaxis sensor kinase CheA
MDVVRSNIEALRGTVRSSSTEARAGSCIEIRLPLTLAIIDGFLVGVGASRFIFPLDAVVEVIEGGGRRRQNTMDSRGRGCVELRGQVLPVVSLRSCTRWTAEAPERISVVVVQCRRRRYGVWSTACWASTRPSSSRWARCSAACAASPARRSSATAKSP